MYLPSAASFALAIVLAGPLTTLIGYYSPIMVFGSVLAIVSMGLITTF